jgi:hypothetical protein
MEPGMDEDGGDQGAGEKKNASTRRDLVSQRTVVILLLVVAAVLAAPYLLRWVNLAPAVEDEVEADRPESLGVRDAVRQVKRELQEADRERLDSGEPALFEVQSFDLELHFVVEQKSSAGVGLEPKLILVNKSSEISAQTVQTIKIHMVAAAPETGEGSVRTESPRDLGTPIGSPPPAMKGADHAKSPQ